MTIKGRLFHRIDGLIAQENGQEKLKGIYTLTPGLATNLHLELIKSFFQDDEEDNKLEAYIRKIGEFLSQNDRYAQLLNTTGEIVQEKITEMG
ncbi:uncharacterized protein CYBJADRAFT_170130 [Cyberlindnera jadinii NRRL Y-1542]|uniref:Uncharacterized protein n=1 Tax=Cyberlindnera jadinii (strain ATCC 18201 / CBS 1600 / BCRC 20928 / JCM 3617 / NBRC 0987 / NRRL Y-1542) TaxID=983966 RepID=A0A1E4RTK7_CYBJN|nr:hypothetical protein CYBJADRAFT_170130 [Cyberlindnera jadinii NRRL Y-1542]ODV70602.1 hypothetical protein CYBJADRAFT_170130 [Cyberlindnera jadinii NRRL Y-1542]